MKIKLNSNKEQGWFFVFGPLWFVLSVMGAKWFYDYWQNRPYRPPAPPKEPTTLSKGLVLALILSITLPILALLLIKAGVYLLTAFAGF